MSSGDGGLDVVVVSSGALLDDASRELAGARDETRSQARSLDSLDARTDRLLDRLGVDRIGPAPVDAGRPQPTRSSVGDLSDESVRTRAVANLADRGIDSAEVRLDELLDDDELARIRRRCTSGVELRARLDAVDVAAAVVAGVVGGVVDALVVRTPAGSPLTEAVKRLAIPSDNWLAGLAEVPYDVAWNAELWLTPRYHRVQTVGHDPLLGLVWGTADILRQTCTGIRPDGTIAVVGRAGSYPTTWPAALARQLLHTLSDLPTAAGIPLPGWAAVSAVPTGAGAQRALGQSMYARGYDSWHFLTMSTAPAAVELLTRAYWAIRREFDDEFRDTTSGQVGHHARFQALALVAHGISAAVDLGAFIAAGSNPLSLNYAQWLTIAKQVVAVAGRPRRGDVAERPLATERLLETGWPV